MIAFLLFSVQKTKDLYDGNLREQQQHVEDIRLGILSPHSAAIIVSNTRDMRQLKKEY